MTHRSVLNSFQLVIILGLLLSACLPDRPQPSASTPVPMPTVATLPTEPVVEATPKPAATEPPKPTNWPRVVSRLPGVSTVTDLTPEIAFVFDQPMDMDSLVQAFEVKPEIGYDLRWKEDRLEVLLDKPLTPASNYRFSIDTTAQSTEGQPLRSDYTWTLYVVPVISKITGPTEDKPEPKIEFEFNYSLNPTSFEQSIQFSPSLKGKWVWGEDRTEAVFTLDDYYEPSTIYRVSFNEELLDTKDGRLAKPETVSFRTPPAVAVVLPTHVPPITSAAEIRIHFNQPMDHVSTEAALKITPDIPGTLTWEHLFLIFKPDRGYLEEFTHYTITVAATAQSIQGKPVLKNDFEYSFETGELQDIASFGYGPNAQVVDAAGRRAVQFVVYDNSVDQIGFALHRLTRTQFLDRYSSSFRGVNGWEQMPISLDDSPLVKEWAADITDSRDATGRGVNEVLIPMDVPPGLYILNLNYGHINDQLILLLSNRTLLVKQAEGELVAWVTDTNDGPAANLPVGVYARDGQLIAQGTTNSEGIFRTQVTKDPQPLIVIAGNENDSTASGLSTEWQSTGGQRYWWQPAPVVQKYGAYIYTDRPIYKPGQTIYYKAIVRRDADARLEVLPKDTLITVRIRDARNNVVQTQQLATNQFGTINGKFEAAPGAMLGDYAVEVEVNGEVHKQTFKVQDYRKPDYEVKVSTNALSYVAGDKIQVVVQAQYLYGEPVANAQVNLIQYEQSRNYCWDVCSGIPAWYQLGARPQSGRTDANGRYTFTVEAGAAAFDNADYWWSNLIYSTVGLEVTVDDGSHQTVSHLTSIKVYNAAEQLRLDTKGYLKTPNQPFEVFLTAQTIQDQPLSGHTYKLQIEQWNSSAGNYQPVMSALSLTTDGNGLATTSLTLPKSGSYRLAIQSFDAHQNEVKVERWLYLMSDADRWTGTSSNVKITADQDTYAPGDTATLLIESPISGPALLTFERGTTRREQVVELTGSLTKVSIPVQPDDAPNIFVTLNQWIPQDTSLDTVSYPEWGNTTMTLADSRLVVASVELHVPVTTKSLTVIITPNKPTYAPREEATFTVRVTDFKGDPVAGEVSLALVDDAIFLLSDDLSGPIFEAFYLERENVVRTYNSLAPSRYLPCECGGGGGGGGIGSSNPRSNFPDTAAWVPVLQTDWKGEATVTFAMPDSLTRWRLTAKATTADTQVGETAITVTTYQPIVVRPLLPRTLTEGDQFELSALVYNYSDLSQTLTVKLDTGDLITSTSPLAQTLTLYAGKQTVVGWVATAAHAGEASLTTSAFTSNEEYGDAVRLPLIIQPLTIPEVTTDVGQFTGSYDSTFTLPAGASEQSTVRIEISRSIAGSLMTGLEYLTGFPYGCVEQTMSKALPNAVVGRAFHQLGLGNPTLQADLPPKVNASIQRLYGYQHNDGGWGWWYDDASDDYQTAWVIFGLSMTAEAGYEVDSGVIKRGAEWLDSRLTSMDKRTRAFALYSLALAGYGNLGATQALARQADTLDAFSQAALALALHKQGAIGEARQVLALLEKSAVIKDGKVYWDTNTDDGHYYQKTMASSTRSTALALSAFVAIDPGNSLQPGIVRYLMSKRQQFGWGTTNETSFTIIGLTDHLLAQQAATEDTVYTVELNGQTVAAGTLGQGEPAATLELPFNQLHIGGNSLRLTQSGGGQLYYVVSNRVYVSQPQVQAAGNVKVTRIYFDGKTNRVLTGPVTAGQLVRVSVTVELLDDGFYILLEDKLPGGFEALNEALNTSSHDGLISEYDFEYGSIFNWQRYGYNNKEVHGDHVSFFITELAKGKRTFSYFVRAVQAGTFVAMPAELTAMYDSTVWGRSASSQLEVIEK